MHRVLCCQPFPNVASQVFPIHTHARRKISLCVCEGGRPGNEARHTLFEAQKHCYMYMYMLTKSISHNISLPVELCTFIDLFQLFPPVVCYPKSPLLLFSPFLLPPLPAPGESLFLPFPVPLSAMSPFMPKKHILLYVVFQHMHTHSLTSTLSTTLCTETVSPSPTKRFVLPSLAVSCPVP